jgi:NAD-dependent deacetylase
MKRLVVLTGAGISAESGLKTFRDSDGLWMGHDIYEVATPEGWHKNPGLVLDFYNMRRKEVAAAFPNAAHKGIADLQDHYNATVITQNIDDLHERAGSTNVVHLHGEIFKMRGQRDEDQLYEIRGDINPGDIAPDNTQFRPHVVWFNEQVPMIIESKRIMSRADIFVLVGTSLQVYPAAGLIDYVGGDVPKYIIDKHPPYIPAHHNFHAIAKSATEGIGELLRILMP